MKVVRWDAAGALRVDPDAPDPVAGPGEVTVRLAACGICGTDLEKLRGNYRSSGGRLGHEPVGAIAAIGPGVRGLSVGARVFVHHHVPCLACDVCARGDLTFCPTYARTNIDPGGFAESFRVPAENVARGAILPLDPSVSWATGTLLEPAGCALTALHRVGLPPHATVLVLGLGPVGLLYARLARALGADWVGGTEIAPLRRAAAERGGIDATVDPREAGAVAALVERATGGRGVDLAVAATGHPAVVRTAAEVVRRGGTVNLFGLPEPGSRLDVDLQQLYLRGVRIVPSYATTEPDIAEVHRRVVAGELRLDDLVTHREPLDRAPAAFELAGRPNEAVKVVVTGPAF
ncbi:MAG TPA: alcohol dehydrogenase catalytic domain-containing protein [Thermoplasmata archaeon]|nr:alcohol dehydrogenase catalytic domain-containing protein [Thermoplasmata archaeon]